MAFPSMADINGGDPNHLYTSPGMILQVVVNDPLIRPLDSHENRHMVGFRNPAPSPGTRSSKYPATPNHRVFKWKIASVNGNVRLR